MGRNKKNRNKGSAASRPAGQGKTRPPASPQQAWEQAIAAYEANRPRDAQALLTPLLDLPSVPGEVSLVAGLVEAQLGDSRRAEEHLRRAVQLVPDRIEGWLGLGNAQHMQGRFDAAVDTFRKVLKRSPENPTALYNMAMAQMDHGRLRDTLDTLDRLLKIQPEWPGAVHNRAIVLTRLGWSREARSAYEALLEASPGDPWLRLEFAGFLEQSNRSEEAADWLPESRAFGDDPRAIAQAESLRAQLLARDGQYEAALERVSRARRETGQDLLGYREGGFLDRLGRPDEAMAAFERANRARARQSDSQRLLTRKYPEYVADKISRGIASPGGVDPEPASAATGRRTPVFLVGLPRSGTTLLDRMLAAHPEVRVLEEFDSLRIAETALAAGRTPEQARAAYWEYVERHIELSEGQLVVDKNPLHAAHLDNLPTLFPDARVIVALRHPYDAALSCFMQDFTPNPATVHFMDLESTAVLCSRLLEMVRLYEQACPETAIRLRYEDLVQDFRSEVTRVLEGVGLAWHEDVAAYAERTGTGGMVTTPSYEQVTQGLYRSSIGRWERYSDWLEPFRTHLSPLLPYFGYDADPGQG